MNKVDIFLESLDKYEIAFLYKYKYKEYLKGTQNKIDKIIEEFNLTEQSINGLVEEREKEPYNNELRKQCIRCKSKKLFFFQDEISQGGGGGTAAIFDIEGYGNEIMKEEKFECAVCGFKPAKDKLPSNIKINSPDVSNGNRVIIILGIAILIIILYFSFRT